MHLRVISDDGETLRAGAERMHPADLAALGPGILFGAFEFASDAADPLLTRVKTRPNVSWWQTLRRDELASATQLALCTHDRGVLLSVRSAPPRIPCSADERLVVCTPSGVAYEAPASLQGLYRLAHEIAFQQTTVNPNLFVKADEPSVPLVYDTRAARGAQGLIAAVLADDDERADALLPLLLETLDPMLALHQAMTAFVAAGRKSSAREMEKLGARHGARWSDYAASLHAPTPPDPVQELIEAGFGNATAAALVWWPAAQLTPTSVVTMAKEGLARWKAVRRETAAWLQERMREMSAEDVYVVLLAFVRTSRALEKWEAIPPLDRREQALTWPGVVGFGEGLRAAWQTPLALLIYLLGPISQEAPELLNAATWPGLLPLLDTLLLESGISLSGKNAYGNKYRFGDPTQRLFGLMWEAGRVAALRSSIAPFDDAFIAFVRTRFTAFAARPSASNKLNVEFAVELLAKHDPEVFRTLSEKAVLAIGARCGTAFVLMLQRVQHKAGVAAIARAPRLDLGMRVHAARVAVELGDASCAELHESLTVQYGKYADRTM